MVRSHADVALAVASSGVAACLLPGGRTAHSMFKMSIDSGPDSFCNIPKESTLAQNIRSAKMIVWDEAPAMPRTLHETLDRSLRDICAFGAEHQHLKHLPFGGKVVVLGGDFRQTLPVIPRGSPAAVINSSLSKSHTLWHHFEYFELDENMRVSKVRQTCPEKAEELQEFAHWLLALGNGSIGEMEDEYKAHVRVLDPQRMIFHSEDSVSSIESLEGFIEKIYGGYRDCPPQGEEGSIEGSLTAQEEFLTKSVIVSVSNKEVDEINNAVMTSSVLGEAFAQQQMSTFLSRDTVKGNRPNIPITESYLNTLEISGLPPHVLKLKVGCPVICIRNLAPSSGITNGTRMVVLDLGTNVIKVKLLTENKKGSVQFLAKKTRILLQMSCTAVSFQGNSSSSRWWSRR